MLKSKHAFSLFVLGAILILCFENCGNLKFQGSDSGQTVGASTEPILADIPPDTLGNLVGCEDLAFETGTAFTTLAPKHVLGPLGEVRELGNPIELRVEYFDQLGVSAILPSEFIVIANQLGITLTNGPWAGASKVVGALTRQGLPTLNFLICKTPVPSPSPTPTPTVAPTVTPPLVPSPTGPLPAALDRECTYTVDSPSLMPFQSYTCTQHGIPSENKFAGVRFVVQVPVYTDSTCSNINPFGGGENFTNFLRASPNGSVPSQGSALGATIDIRQSIPCTRIAGSEINPLYMRSDSPLGHWDPNASQCVWRSTDPAGCPP